MAENVTAETVETVAVTVRLPRELWLRATMRSKSERNSLQEVGRAMFEEYAAGDWSPADSEESLA